MEAKEKAEELVNLYRIILMESDTDAGEEIICSLLAKKCALLLVNKRLQELNFTHIGYGKSIMQGYQKTKLKFWNEVKNELENLEK